MDGVFEYARRAHACTQTYRPGENQRNLPAGDILLLMGRSLLLLPLIMIDVEMFPPSLAFDLFYSLSAPHRSAPPRMFSLASLFVSVALSPSFAHNKNTLQQIAANDH